MAITEDLKTELNKWAPALAESLTNLAYLGSGPSMRWLTSSPAAIEFQRLFSEDAHESATDIWCSVIRNKRDLPAPIFLLIQEHMRRNPAKLASTLRGRGFRLSISLANVSMRAAGAIYEDAKTSFARHEIDIAASRFRAALFDFRFAIDSNILALAPLRIATGKYAAAVAMIGRWINVSPDTITRAISYSKQSMQLGNLTREHLNYRIELLILRFDQTGDTGSLYDALTLIESNRSIAAGSELIEAETHYRISLLKNNSPEKREKCIASAKNAISRIGPNNSGSLEEARSAILSMLISQTEQRQIDISATSVAIPRGLLSHMAKKPSAQAWKAARQIVRMLETLRHRESIPAAVLGANILRQIVEGPSELLQQRDLTLYVEVTKWLSENAPYNRHARWEAGAAALTAAKRSGKKKLALSALDTFQKLAYLDSDWPLPRIGIARARDYLGGGENSPISTGSWKEAAKLTLASPNYARSNLGGRNEVFAVTDARGFLSYTFVFKRTTKLKAEHEASMLKSLRDEIDNQAKGNLFEVPRSLAIVEVPSDDERKWVHVTQRSAGRLLSEIPAKEASSYLESVTYLLATFHQAAGTPPTGKSAWRPLKVYLKMWSRTIFKNDHSDEFVAALHRTFPSHIRLVRKRDGHASNWLIDPAGRIVAIDFESVEFITAGYDVAQLIEDFAIIQPDSAGWERRIDIMTQYMQLIEMEIDREGISNAYGWFAITRALRLGTERLASKSLRRHAREICAMVADHCTDDLAQIARELQLALAQVDQADAHQSPPSHDHRRLSKSMSHLLRHHGPKKGVPVDEFGFAAMDDLARALEVDASSLLAVAEHPGEPRFEVRDGFIRALYGHSLDVKIDGVIKVGPPTILFHGSNWGTIDKIIEEGLKPMSRRMVHLTNNANEAISVAERKGATLLLSIDYSENEEPVAEGIWVAPKVGPERLRIVNIFRYENGVFH
ncbi:TPA: RNA 2'-phosphotransferase [Stenotrophomonas maltophilia]